MKRRFSSHMTLIELTLALFFLMLAMVTIIGLFTTAYSMSEEAERITKATQLAQDCASLIEGSQDPVAALAACGYEKGNTSGSMRLSVGDMVVNVQLGGEQTEVGCLYEGTIEIKHTDDQLMTWPVARYIIRK